MKKDRETDITGEMKREKRVKQRHKEIKGNRDTKRDRYNRRNEKREESETEI
jgi:hypothetical protein